MYCDVSSVRQVAVYCASSFGRHPLYADVAAEFGRILAERNIGLVYGGSGTGTMRLPLGVPPGTAPERPHPDA